MDSLYSHLHFGLYLGGVSLPLLADFHPKGAVADAYGMYLAGAGISDRATVIIDAQGIVRYAESVGPGGERDIDALLETCRRLDTDYADNLPGVASAAGLPSEATLYIKGSCGFSAAVMAVYENLHLQGRLNVLNVTEDATASEALVAAGGKEQAPCLVMDGVAQYESKDIIATLLGRIG